MSEIDVAADVLRAGGLVVFPTETVYGLGAVCTDDKAVAGIYELKGRPTFNPLISHVDSVEMAEEYVEVTPLARRLMAEFCPGPLTLVLKKKQDSRISLLATAGLDTSGIRIPNHPMTLELIKKTGVPLVAPSANPSGKVSPTTAKHVRDAFGQRCPMVLDGGDCAVGLESTILLMTTDTPVLLRYGGLSVDDIESVIGPVVRPEKDPDAPQSPGQLKSHYAPNLILRKDVALSDVRDGEAVLGFGDCPSATLNLSPSGDLKEAAANLFSMVIELDNPSKFTGIAVMPIPMQGLGYAINDRLKRAAYDRG